MMAWLFFFTAIVAIPALPEGMSGPKWVILSLGIPYFFALKGWKSVSKEVLWGCAAFAFIAVLSLLQEKIPSAGIGQVWEICLFCLTVILGASADEKEWDAGFAGAAWGLLLSSGMVLGELWYGSPLFGTLPWSGLLGNKSMLGEGTVLVLLWAVSRKKWGLVVGLCPAVVLPFSCAAFGAIALSVLRKLWLVRSTNWRLVGGFLLLILSGLVFFSPYAVGESLHIRMELWKAALEHLVWLGHGAGAFAVDISFLSHSPVLGNHLWSQPHNEIVGWLYEFGLGALAPFGLILLSLFGKGDDAAKNVVWGAVAIAMVSFPLHCPLECALVGLAVGRAASGRAVLCTGSEFFPHTDWDWFKRWRSERRARAVDCCGPHSSLD